MKKKVCVVGAGSWGKNHIRTLSEIGCLSGIVDSNPSMLHDFTNLEGIFIYNSIEDALSSEEFDAFVVATPPSTHFEIALKILNCEKHVLVEKPLTLNYEDSKILTSLSIKKNVNLMVGHVLLFHPAIIKIKELIQDGAIGNLQYIYSNRLNLGQVRKIENVFWSLAPHDISIFQFLIDKYPNEIRVKGSSFVQSNIHDITITQLKYPGGIEGHIFLSWIHPFKEHRIVIVGTEGMITFEDSLENKPLKMHAKKIKIDNDLPNIINKGYELIEYNSSPPLTNQLKFFIDNLDSQINDSSSISKMLDISRILFEASKQLENNN